jgi:very-short-patch-repair endonuclease
MEKCKICGKEYSKFGIGNHIWRTHGEGKTHKPNKDKIGWNKGLTKETDERVKRGGETFSKRLKNGEIKHSQEGKPLSKEHKKKVSESMKKAHKEGRAWNIGMSRWNNESSYPEEFFMKVIANEFEDKNYINEHPVGIYSLDFAWVHKKKVIEIDGAQHQRFEEYKERDKRKDKFLIKEGWQILRVSWKDISNNTKQEIQKCKDFIS